MHLFKFHRFLVFGACKTRFAVERVKSVFELRCEFSSPEDFSLFDRHARRVGWKLDCQALCHFMFRHVKVPIGSIGITKFCIAL